MDKIKSIGKGYFGNVYDRFEGNAQQAFQFLSYKKEGDALGVFHRDGLGDVDVVWGSAESNLGLAHIENKHIRKYNDFNSLEEAAGIIDDVVKNGRICKENENRAEIEKDGYKVVVSKHIERNGKKLQDKNWVLTAFDNSRHNKKRKTSSGSSLYPLEPTNDANGRAFPLNDVNSSQDNPDVSADKGINKFPNIQKTLPARSRILRKKPQTLLLWATKLPQLNKKCRQCSRKKNCTFVQNYCISTLIPFQNELF
ncbi:MAG: hypothetical protein LBU51_01745 [Bacteroidales bacterium]|jgi:hypothetical protein|nr:hypothetical protein [Bacteroidales bacterium]